MLSINNSSILLVITLLSTISAFISPLLSPFLACLVRRSEEEEELLIEIRRLKVEIAGIPMKEEFANYAKKTRILNKVEDQYKTLVQTRQAKNMMYKFTMTKGLEIFIGILTVAISLWFRREPIVIFHQNLLPFNSFLSYPCVEENAISPHAWLIISRISIGALKGLVNK